jgi:uncharacterized protein
VLTDTASGVVLDVRVIPRAKKTAIAGVRDDALVVRLAAPPVEGAANDALLDLLATLLRLPRRAIRIVSGERGRHKRVAIEGVTAEMVLARLV